MIEISVLLPIGHVDQYLVDSVASTINDLPTDGELVICGTTRVRADWPEELAYVWDNPQVTFAQSHSGDIVSNLNAGLKAATGIYIARMDADDRVIAGRFETQKRYLQNNSQAAMVGSNLLYICSHGVPKGVERYPKVIRRKNIFPIAPKVAHPSVMIRREILDAVGGYSHNYPHVEDLDLWLRILHVGEIHNINDQELLEYRLHGGQISRLKSDEQAKYGLLALINDSRYKSGRRVLDTAEFASEHVDELLVDIGRLTSKMRITDRFIYAVKSQETILERRYIGELHSSTPRTNIKKLLTRKLSPELMAALRENLAGFVLILAKIAWRNRKSLRSVRPNLSSPPVRVFSQCEECQSQK